MEPETQDESAGKILPRKSLGSAVVTGGKPFQETGPVHVGDGVVRRVVGWDVVEGAVALEQLGKGHQSVSAGFDLADQRRESVRSVCRVEVQQDDGARMQLGHDARHDRIRAYAQVVAGAVSPGHRFKKALLRRDIEHQRVGVAAGRAEEVGGVRAGHLPERLHAASDVLLQEVGVAPGELDMAQRVVAHLEKRIARDCVHHGLAFQVGGTYQEQRGWRGGQAQGPQDGEAEGRVVVVVESQSDPAAAGRTAADETRECGPRHADGIKGDGRSGAVGDVGGRGYRRR